MSLFSPPNDSEQERNRPTITSIGSFHSLNNALQVLEKHADTLPTFKSVITEFVACLDNTQSYFISAREPQQSSLHISLPSENDVQNYEALISRLVTSVIPLNQCLQELGLEDPNGNIEHIALSVRVEVGHVNIRENRGASARMDQPMQNKDNVFKHLHEIGRLFQQLQGEVGLWAWRKVHEQRVKIHLQGMTRIDNAGYSSTCWAAVEQRTWTSETQEHVQKDLRKWVQDPTGARVYWMSGAAGTGKTTTAYNLCEWLESHQRLGASLFYSHISARRDVSSIVPTITYQLAQHSLAFRMTLLTPPKGGVGRLNVTQQFEKLVREPLLAARGAMPGLEDMVVVIDGLGQCENDHAVWVILGTLLKLGENLPIKFFVTSRPGPEMSDNIVTLGRYSSLMLRIHDIDYPTVGDDIKKYFAEAFSAMSPSPSNQQIAQLAKRSGNSFVYATTVVRYVQPRAANAILRLSAVLAADSPTFAKDEQRNQYQQLDQLYITILASAFYDKSLEEAEKKFMWLVLWTVVCLKEPMTISTLAVFLGITKTQVSSALQPLQAVLHVSDSNDAVSPLHTTFFDYMLDPLRSTIFCCDQTSHSKFMAHRCFDLMKAQLRFNICNLESSFKFDKDVPGLEQRIQANIPPSLSYACQYWGDHLFLVGASSLLCQKLAEFLSDRLLFWVEVLNLQQRLIVGISALVRAEYRLLMDGAPLSMHRQVVDAREFTTWLAASECGRSTPHIYISALPFCRKSSTVYAHYWRRTQMLMDVQGVAIDQRDKGALATWVSSRRVFSVSFSPDGMRIASGSSDNYVWVRDVRTGEILAGPFTGHVNFVNSVMFSPDGMCIASGSSDHTIRLWDSRTGEAMIEPFLGHSDSVKSVSFSSAGTYLASGSEDMTIRVWDVRTGHNVVGPFTEHTGSVNTVAFSPDSTRIVSGASDKTVRVWSIRKGITVLGPLSGHTDSVNSVAFSPDSQHIVSCSDDKTIRMWDADTGSPAGPGQFIGHTRAVCSVSFAPDGSRIASCAGDGTIRVWDIYTGTTVAGPFEGHMYWIHSVVFSPDGVKLASGCGGDGTIRLWDANPTSTVDEAPRGHSGWIASVALSPDGTRIASGSDDMTIKLWSMATGLSISGPLEGHTEWVNSVAFSPDSKRLASASGDKTVRVWNLHSSQLATAPLIGHTASVNSVSFSPNGTLIVSGSSDKTIRLWDPQTGQTVGSPLTGHTHRVNSVAFSPDATRVTSGSNDASIRVWDVRTGGTIIGPLQGGTFKSVVFSPDGTSIVSGSNWAGIQIWDTRTGRTTDKPLAAHGTQIQSVAISPDGALLASCAEDLRVWDACTGNMIASFDCHRQWVMSVVFSPDGRRIVSSSGDHTIRVLNLHAHLFRLSSPSYRRPPGLVYSAPATVQTASDPIDDLPEMLASLALSTDKKGYDLTGVEFRVSDGGWVTSGDIPLFWAPPDLTSQLPRPYEDFVIGIQGSLSIDYQNLALGKQWTECYISP